MHQVILHRFLLSLRPNGFGPAARTGAAMPFCEKENQIMARTSHRTHSALLLTLVCLLLGPSFGPAGAALAAHQSIFAGDTAAPPRFAQPSLSSNSGARLVKDLTP